MPRRPDVVAFDVNETLVSLEPIAQLLPDGMLPLWFARILRDGFALAVTGEASTFPELGRAHLAGVVDDPDAVVARFAELDAYPDVRPAMERLREADVRVVTLTNGSAANTEVLLERKGLSDLVERCLSADAVGVWKPRPEPYLYAAESCGVAAGGLALVAVHSWDIHGAKRAGLTAAWCSRLEGRPVAPLAGADVVGDDLVAVVDGLLSLDG